MVAWQVAQAGLLRCSAIRSRTERTLALLPSEGSGRLGTLGGGGGGGVPSRFSRIHFPRSTGAVRFGRDVTVKMLP